MEGISEGGNASEERKLWSAGSCVGCGKMCNRNRSRTEGREPRTKPAAMKAGVEDTRTAFRVLAADGPRERAEREGVEEGMDEKRRQ